MTRQTDQHGWDVPEPGDQDYATIIENLADAIDEHVPIDPDSEPTAQTEGRIIVNRHRDRPVPVLMFDDGTDLIQIRTSQRWDVHDVLWKSRYQTVIDQWTFTEDIDADVTGNASFAPVADEADVTVDADRLDGNPPSSYARRTTSNTVSEAWTFREPVRFKDGFEVTTGALTLPVYDQPSDEGSGGGGGDDDGGTQPEPSLAFETGDATGITQSSVTLRANVNELGGYDRLYLGFEIREDGTNAWPVSGPTIEVNEPTTVKRTYPTSDGYGSDLLEPGTTYEYRAFVNDGPDSIVGVGNIRAFTLDD